MSNDYAGTWIIIIIIGNIYYLCTFIYLFIKNIATVMWITTKLPKKCQNMSYLTCKYAVTFKYLLLILLLQNVLFIYLYYL